MKGAEALYNLQRSLAIAIYAGGKEAHLEQLNVRNESDNQHTEFR
jgi:hypothetical protein